MHVISVQTGPARWNIEWSGFKFGLVQEVIRISTGSILCLITHLEVRLSDIGLTGKPLN